MTIGKLRNYVLFGLIALVLKVSFNFISLKMGLGIEGVAVGGTLITFSIYAALSICYALYHFTRQWGDWVKFWGKILLPFSYVVLLLMGLESLFPASGNPELFDIVLVLGIRWVLFVLGCFPLLLAALREADLISENCAPIHLWERGVSCADMGIRKSIKWLNGEKENDGK